MTTDLMTDPPPPTPLDLFGDPGSLAAIVSSGRASVRDASPALISTPVVASVACPVVEASSVIAPAFMEA